MSSRSWSLRVWSRRSPTRKPVPGTGAPSGFSRRAQLLVERVDADRAAVHRREHQDVAARVEAEVAGQALGRERDDLGEDLGRLVAHDAEEVAHVALGGLRRRLPALVDRVGGAHDQRPRRLAEDLGQRAPSARARSRCRSSSTRPAPTGAQLVDVADEQDVRAAARRRRAARRRGGRTASTPRRRRARRRRGSGRPGRARSPRPAPTRAGGGSSSPAPRSASARRRAALPVGAHSRTLRPAPRSTSTSARIDARLAGARGRR